MKIYSDILTREDIYSAVRGTGAWIHSCSQHRSRSHQRSFTVYLEGNSVYARNAPSGGQSATWDEHGLWMDALFAIDPDAVIAHYQGYADFVNQTRVFADRVKRDYKPHTLYAKTHLAPWLAKERIVA